VSAVYGDTQDKAQQSEAVRRLRKLVAAVPGGKIGGLFGNSAILESVSGKRIEVVHSYIRTVRDVRRALQK